MADTPCAHERITTASADGLPSLWYCDDCRRRFYPACLVCVDVGHRNETHAHTPTPDPAAVAAHPDDDFVARAQHYREEHEATHEEEMCGGPCIVLGLCDDALTDPTSAEPGPAQSGPEPEQGPSPGSAHPDPVAAALAVARHFDAESFACDFGGRTAINLPNLEQVIPLTTQEAGR